MRRRSVIAVIALLAGCLLPTVPAAAGQSMQPDDLTPTLPTGHSLTARRDYPYASLVSTSQRFAFRIFQNQVEIDNDTRPNRAYDGTYPTLEISGYGREPRSSTLHMRSDGDLVARNSDGHVLWSTHTAGTGRHNYARMLDSGALVVRTASGRTVWSSHTTAVELTNRDHLLPGHTLVNRTGDETTRLTMRTTGDLVLRRGWHRVWHTDTHVPGSRLVISRSGRMVVVTPGGRWIWHSPRAGYRALVTLAQNGRLTLEKAVGRFCWQRPAHSSHDCLAG